MKNTAVFLGRFSPLQKGHISIIDKMIHKHGIDNSLIMIGSSNTLNERTPYTYEQRAEMIKVVYPGIKTLPLPDGKPDLVYFDGTTNESWLDSIKKIQEKLKANFVFYGGSKEDLEILAERFKTKILVDRLASPNLSSTNVRKALEINDQKLLEQLLDPKVIPLAKMYYQKYKENRE